VSKYLKFFPKKKEGAITIRHLLNHSSGIKAYKNSKEAFPSTEYTSLQKAIEVFQDRKLAFKPGEGYQYTTYGYVVLGAVIEAAPGLSYREYMKQHVWEPIGMNHTDVEYFDKAYSNKAKLYKLTEAFEIEADVKTNLTVKVPGGGIHSTVEDLLKFGQAILDHKLVKPSTFEMMIEDIGHKQRGNPYGFGWFIYGKEDHRSGRIIGHSGAQSGTSTQLLIFLDRKAVEVVLSNTANAWGRTMGLIDRLARNYLNSTNFKRSSARVFVQHWKSKGLSPAVQWIQNIKEDEHYEYLENDMNELGYFLMNKGHAKEAIKIFKINTEAFPESSNVFDSLGEAYLKMGDKSKARTNYEKALALNPLNDNAEKALKKLK
ncbi:MAG: serine hydrolase, partial [Bacteroidota bacterium]